MLQVNELIGFGAASTSMISFFATADADAGVGVTVPAGVIAGDALLLIENAFGTSSASVPSGFTQIATDTDGAATRIVTSYKVAIGNESGTSIISMTGSDNDFRDIMVIRPDVPPKQWSVGSVDSEGGSGNPTAQVVTVSGIAFPLIVACFYSATSAITSNTFSPTKDGDFYDYASDIASYKIYNSSPQNTTVDMDDEGFNILQSFYLMAG